METTVYVVVKVCVRHEAKQTPEEIIGECNYEFAIEPDNGKQTPKIVNTEIVSVLDKSPE